MKDKNGNETVDIWLEKDILNNHYYCLVKKLNDMIPLMSHNTLLYNVIDTRKFEVLENKKHILTCFASFIDIINMNNIPLENTIKLMKNKNNISQKVVNFIRNCDLHIDDFEYVDMKNIQFPENFKIEQIAENVLHSKETLMDQVRLVTTYKGVTVPSLLFDSAGTKKDCFISKLHNRSIRRRKNTNN